MTLILSFFLVCLLLQRYEASRFRPRCRRFSLQNPTTRSELAQRRWIDFGITIWYTCKILFVVVCITNGWHVVQLSQGCLDSCSQASRLIWQETASIGTRRPQLSIDCMLFVACLLACYILVFRAYTYCLLVCVFVLFCLLMFFFCICRLGTNCQFVSWKCHRYTRHSGVQHAIQALGDNEVNIFCICSCVRCNWFADRGANEDAWAAERRRSTSLHACNSQTWRWHTRSIDPWFVQAHRHAWWSSYAGTTQSQRVRYRPAYSSSCLRIDISFSKLAPR